MPRRVQDITRMATKLIADYGNEAETEAVERAELLHAIGSHKEADLWMAIMAHVANIRQSPQGVKLRP
jgi:hypothetical protein